MEEKKRKGKIKSEINKKPNNLREYLNTLYKNPLTFSNSIEGLYQSATKHNRWNFLITRDDIRQFLSTQPAYELVQPIKKYKQQKRTVVDDRNRKYQMDLIDFRHYAAQDEGVQYLFTMIDVFSKYAFVFPLQNKSSSHVAKILALVFKYQKPVILLSDNGKEFVNKKVKRVTNRFGVHHFTTYPYTPLGIIERFNKTIKNKLFAYMKINNTQRYIDVLDQIVLNYNKTKHSTIQEIPSYIHFCSDDQKECQRSREQKHQRLQNIDEKINATARNHFTPYQIGDAVRVVAYLDPEMSRFDQFNAYKVYHKIKNPKWTDKIYLISRIYYDGYIVKYKVKGSKDNETLRKYYHHELQPVFDELLIPLA